MHNPERVAVCTTTFYPKWTPGVADVDALLERGDRAVAESKIRGDLALETAQEVLRAGYQLILVDGGEEDSAFQRELQERNIPFMLEQQRGMSASRRQTFQAAYEKPEIDVVTWMEPEKVGMIGEIDALASTMMEGDMGVIIPARGQEGWNSMPSYQRESEMQANAVFNDKLDRSSLHSPEMGALDMYFGPRLYNFSEGFRERMWDILQRRYAFEKNPRIPLHQVVNPGGYSEATFFPPVAAMDEGLLVESLPTGFVYPEAQRKLEEHPPFVEGENGYRAKRQKQSVGILTELVYYLRGMGSLGGVKRLEELS